MTTQRIGLMLDMVGAVLLAIDVLGDKNIIYIRTRALRFISRWQPPPPGSQGWKDNQELAWKIQYILNDDDFCNQLKRLFHKTSQQFKRLVFLLPFKLILLLALQRVINVACAPILFLLHLQDNTGVRVVNLAGLLFVIAGFVCQFSSAS